MFHRNKFLLLIISSLSCNFNRCADCFQSLSEQRFPEYSKCLALNHFKIKNKHNKFFIMQERNSVNVHSNTRHSQHCKTQNRLAVQYVVLGPRVKVINLNILPESSCNELKYSLEIAFMFLSIVLKFQVPDINILLEIRKKATVFDGPWSANLVLGPRLW